MKVRYRYERGYWCAYKWREPFQDQPGFWELIGLTHDPAKLVRFAEGFVNELTCYWYGDAKPAT